MSAVSYLPILIIIAGLTFVGMSFFLYLQRRTTNKVRAKSQQSLEKEINDARSQLSFRLQLATNEEKEKPKFIEGRSPAQVLIPVLIAGVSLLYLANRMFGPEVSENGPGFVEGAQVATARVRETYQKAQMPEMLPSQPTEVAPPPPPAPTPPMQVVAQPTAPAPSAPTAAVKKEWRQARTPDFPALENFMGEIRNHQFVFIYDKADETFRIPKSKGSPLLSSLSAWKKWTEHYKIPTEKCDWRTLPRCQKSNGKKIFVILPGNWNFNQIEKLMAQGEHIILFGMPYQLFDPKRNKPVNFKNLVFEKFNKDVENWLIVRGDQALTLGLDAGLRLSVPPLFANYRVRSSTPHATGVAPEGFAAPVRLDIVKDTRARVIWMDFTPDIKGPTEGIQAGIFRYLLRKKHWSFSNWPSKSSVTAMLLLETQDLAKDAKEIRAALRENYLDDTPIAWIVDSKQFKSEAKLGDQDSVICRISFAGDSLPVAAKKVSDCKAAVRLHTRTDVAGITTNDPSIAPVTYDALNSHHLEFLFVRNNSPSPMPYAMKSGREYVVVLPTSYNTLFTLSPKAAEQHFRIARNSNSLSLVTMPASQFLAGAKFFRDLYKNISSVQGRFVSAGEFTEWRTSRERLLWGESVLAATSAKYQPFSLRVDETGSLLPQGLNGTPDRMPASVMPEDEK